MQNVEILLTLLLAVVALVALAKRLDMPYPVLLVIGGLVLGFVPGLPRIELSPELVFLLFLPPLLYWEALTSSARDFRANLRSIALLSVGLVLATTCAVAAVAHAAIPGLTWPAAFVLGAIVSPTDAVAATTIGQRLGVPRRVMTVLEGESLVNDATALVAYRSAVAAAVAGSFSLLHASLQFLLVAAGGVVVGLIAGWAVAQVRRRLADPPLENTVSLLTPFIAYVPADLLGVSGVLAVVAAGLYLGRVGPRMVSARTRLQAQEVWSLLVFVLNGIIFILIGLQLHAILNAVSARPIGTLIWEALLVSLTVIAARMIWILPGTYLPRLIDRWLGNEVALPPWQLAVVVGWSGMSGVVSLASALAIPVSTDAHAPFPQRDLIIYLAFAVILVTLVAKGLSLPLLIRVLRIRDDGVAEREEWKARLKATRAAMVRLEALAAEDGVPQDIVDDLRSHYEERIQRLQAQHADDGDGTAEQRAAVAQRLRRELLLAERSMVVRLRDSGVINDEVMSRVQRELDLESLRLEEPGERR